MEATQRFENTELERIPLPIGLRRKRGIPAPLMIFAHKPQ
jgi:hypothetical protein